MSDKEKKLIILLVKYELNSKEEKYLKELLTYDLDWGSISYQIIKNKIGGLVWKNLKEYVLSDPNVQFPFPEFIKYSYSTYIYQKKKGLEQEKLTKDILNDFDENNLEYVLLKGISVIISIYNDYGLRTFNDNDLLIDKDNINFANTLLKNKGYIQGDITSFINFRETSKKENLIWSISSHELMPYTKFLSENDAHFLYHIIDIHYSANLMTKKRNNDFTIEMLANKVNIQNINILDTKYLLLFLCEHFYKEAIYIEPYKENNDISLYKLCDIHYLISIKTIDWSSVYTLSKKLDLEKPLTYTLKYVFEIFGNKYFEEIESLVNKHIQSKNTMDIVYEYDSEKVAYVYQTQNYLDRILDI